VATESRSPAELEALADSGLIVSCAAVGRGLTTGQTLDAAELSPRRAALDMFKRHLDDAALLGATTAYLVPGLDTSADAQLRFTDACRLLAEHAAARMIRLCVEHVPGRALAEVRQVLAWLQEAAHPNLYLLLDVGHCLLTKEDAAASVHAAGPRLGHVHVDDNDAARDLHLPLLAGKLTEEDLRRALAALHTSGYAGGVSLELSPENPQPREAVRDSKAILDRLIVAKP
jgi:sugar phosphate isomerase/epimerase